jgi:methionyl-tRNA formyltransferase
MTPLRLVFMGTPDFAVSILDGLVEAGHEVVCVYSQPPRPAGRGHKERPSPVQAYAETRGIPVRTPKTLRTGEAQGEFAGLKTDVAVVAAYGLILPKPVLEAPRLGCINVHASLLPRWRGAAPLHHAILAGDKETGVCIMQMDEGLDTGPVLLSEAVPIGPGTTTGELHDTLAALGRRLIVEALEGRATDKLLPKPQPSEGATYAPKIEPQAGRLDWTRPAAELERLVRGFTPWPGAWFEHGGQRLKVMAAELADRKASVEPGTVQDDRLAIACAEGALRILRLQRPGKGPMEAEAFLRGYAIPAGTRLG